MLTTLKRWVQRTIGASSKEANAFIILLPALFLVIFSQPLYRWLWVGDQPLSVQETFLLDSLVTQKALEKEPIKDSISLRIFNPNSTSVNELVSIGIPKVVAKRIDLYRAKGGKFRVKDDLAKMYGLDSLLYLTLKPYIDLPETIALNSDKIVSLKSPTLIIEYDLNKADTADFKSVKGIGPVLAARIMKYRQSLGGFVSTNQLTEVFGLDSTVLKELQTFQVKPDFIPAKLRINQVTEQELDKHPYLSLRQARAILAYKMQHGNFSSLDDLREVKLLDDKVILKIQPYLSFE